MRSAARSICGRNVAKLIAIATSALSPVGFAFGADGNAAVMWRAVTQIPPQHVLAEPWIRPVAFEAFDLDPESLQATLSLAPLEFTLAAEQRGSIAAQRPPIQTRLCVARWSAPEARTRSASANASRRLPIPTA